MSEAAVKTKKPSKVNAKLIGDLAPYLGLVLVVIVFYILTNKNLLSWTNIQAMSSNVITTTLPPFFRRADTRKNSPVLNAIKARAISGRKAVP